MVIYTIISSELHKIQLNVNLNSKGIYCLMFLAEMCLLLGFEVDWLSYSLMLPGTKFIYCCCWKYIFLWLSDDFSSTQD